MERRSFLKFSAISTLAASTAFASGSEHGSTESTEHIQAVATKMFNEIVKSNDYYVKTKGADYFKSITAGQHPRATVVGCCDSRFQSGVIDSTPENDIFVIRNVGNQFMSNEGSITYGIVHLHTPLLLIVGHTRCGAIKAAMSDYTGEDSSLRREVDGLALSIRKSVLKGNDIEQWGQAVVSNTNQQVQYSLAKYKDIVESGKLTVVGLVYDLANDFGKGAGRLHITSVNGETSPEKLKDIALIKAVM